MDTILTRIDRLMMSLTFAEANAPDLARECLGSGKPTQSNRPRQTAQAPGDRIAANQTSH